MAARDSRAAAAAPRTKLHCAQRANINMPGANAASDTTAGNVIIRSGMKAASNAALSLGPLYSLAKLLLYWPGAAGAKALHTTRASVQP